MDLTKVKKVVSIQGSNNVNRMIEVGWSLIAVATGQDEARYPLTIYTLGWLGEGEPVDIDLF